MKGEVNNLYNEIDSETWSLTILSKTYGNCVFIIDKEDLEKIQQYKWCVSKVQVDDYEIYLYAITSSNKEKKLLHRYIMDAPKGKIVDHQDHNTFNTRKSNLRICNRSNNGSNRIKQSNNTSGHPGVFWWHYNDYNKWQANIKTEDKRIILGYFDKYEDAVKARQDAEVKYFGEYRNVID